jgi:proline racemase
MLNGPIRVVDYHTAGEPFRIVTGGGPELQGATVLDRRDFAQTNRDEVRQLLVNEPRGHADMYGGFVTPPDDPAADLGVVFFHKDGYSTACGHGTIALVTWAIESGRIPLEGEDRRVIVDTPSGRVATAAELDGDRVSAVSFINVPSFVSGRHLAVQLSSGVIDVDVAYGGAYYASIDAAQLELAATPENLGRFIELGREIKGILGGNPAVEHPVDERLSGLYGTIFFEHLGRNEEGIHQRNVTVFADGEVDRSPCGSGTSARLALLDSAADLARGEILTHEGIIGTTFTGSVVADGDVAGRRAVITRVRGSAHRTGSAVFTLDQDDPIGLGFQLR